MKINRDYVKVKLLKCSHCEEFHTDSLKYMQNHLNECLVNPTSRSCVRCKHLEKHNIMDMEHGKPVSYFRCNKLDKLVDEFELKELDKECYETRKEVKINTINAKAYETYLENLVEKIEKTMN